MQIAIIGSGYVGLVSGACFADFGHHVTCVDLDQSKIDMLSAGQPPIFEPGLSDLLKGNIASHHLTFTTDIKEAVAKADVVFIAVGTPSRPTDGHADLGYVHQAARDIASALNSYTVVVTKSTVPVGTGDDVERIIRETNPNADFDVVSNPEFLREGAAIHDFKRPDRIIVGLDAHADRARQVMSEVYRPLFLNQSPLLFVSRRTSELTKYAANAFLAAKITFINEIADLCEAVGADVQDVAHGIGLDKRIGPKFLQAGPGYGGSCFPKDTTALVKTAQDSGTPMRMIEATVTINETRKRGMARKVIEACGGDIQGKRIAVLGLTFKPNTDDMREAPSISIIQALQDRGAQVRAYDPEGMGVAKTLLSDVTFGASPYEIAEGADAVVIVTEWDAFRALDLTRLGKTMNARVLIDLRNIYDHEQVEEFGFVYRSVGRPSADTKVLYGRRSADVLPISGKAKTGA